MLPVVGVGPTDERAVALSDELLTHGGVYPDVAQWRSYGVVKGIYAGPGEAHAVARADEEDPFVCVSAG